MKLLIYLVLQVVLLPLTLVGYVFVVVQTMTSAKKYGVSATATNILGSRWMMHVFGTRPDDATAKLIVGLPFMSETGLWLAIGPAYLAHRLCGYVPGLARFVAPTDGAFPSLTNMRTPLLDAMVARNLDLVEQVVVLGAGFDTRAFGVCRGRGLPIFELDQAHTQQTKVAALGRGGVDTGGVTFVPVDFTEKAWSEALLASDFDPAKKTFFLWEGVTLYLDEADVKRTLKDVVEISPAGSGIAFDFYSKQFVNFDTSFLMKTYGKQMLKASGEPFKYGIDTESDPREQVTALLREAGLTLVSLDLLGAEAPPFAGVVEARRG